MLPITLKRAVTGLAAVDALCVTHGIKFYCAFVDGDTALILSAWYGHPTITRRLLENKVCEPKRL